MKLILIIIAISVYNKMEGLFSNIQKIIIALVQR